MKKTYKVKQMAETRWLYMFEEINYKKEKIFMEFSKVEDYKGSRSLPKLWYEEHYLNRVLPDYWSLHTYVIDKDRNSYHKYNPQINIGGSINFNWIFEATEENKEKLINEVYRLANS